MHDPATAIRHGTDSELSRHMSTELRARKYLLALCGNMGQVGCPRCRCGRIYDLADGRKRCGGCRYTFQDFTGRWINNGGLSCSQWLRLADLFSRETAVHAMAAEMGISYNAVYKAVTAIRYSILSQSLDARALLSPGGPLGSSIKGFKLTGEPENAKPGQPPVFGIIEEGGMAFIDYIPELAAETIFHFHINFQLRLVRMNNIIYTDRYRRYHALIFCADAALPLNYIRSYDRTPYVDTESHRFWHFARQRIKRYKGLSPHRFPLYLKELEFRYNNRGQDLAPLFLRSLCALVPDVRQGLKG